MSFLEGLVATGIGMAIVIIVPNLYKYIKAKIKGETTQTDKTIKQMNSLGFTKYRQMYLGSLKKQIKDFNYTKEELFGEIKSEDIMRRLLIKENQKQIKKYSIMESELF